MKRSLACLSILTLLSLTYAGCNAESGIDGASGDAAPIPVKELTQSRSAIINGTRVTGKEYYSAVSIFIEYSASGSPSSQSLLTREPSCSGTLISPNFVLTAGHCISDCTENGRSNETSYFRPYMRIGFGTTVSNPDYSYEIAEFITHPDFVCTTHDIRNDIALIRLKTAVPESVASPTEILPPPLALSADEVSSSRIAVTHVGFGETQANNTSSAGVKYKADNVIYAYCPLSGTCPRSDMLVRGFIYTYQRDAKDANICSGDSGGPLYLTRNGTTYVAGVTSWGEEDCVGWGAMTNVTDYYDDFLAPHLETKYEICGNGIDDNDDGLIDCDDPQCAQDLECQPEVCNDGIDNNGDGLADCQDPQCADSLYCQPEDCGNGIDDNGNGLVDCKDPQCADLLKCQPEICNDGIDNNGDGLVDCDDSQCADSLYCQPEDCSNNKDDNGDGLIDCQDPLCSSLPKCQPEICNDNIDNNGDGLVDCQDPQCFGSESCMTEICDNGIDDNGNGLVDCDDIQCALTAACAKEICNDGIDNNADGYADCDDPQCSDASACHATGNCSSLPRNPGHSSLPPAFLIMLGGIVLAKRRKSRA